MSEQLDAVLTATGDAAHTVLEDFEAISSTAEVLLVLAYHRRRVVYFNVTEHPAAKWTAQQIVEAFPWDTSPKYLLRDRDNVHGAEFRKPVHGLGVEELLIAHRKPWQNAFAERILSSYLNYYHTWRTHLSLEPNTPEHRPVQPPDLGRVVECSEVGGLQRHYECRATGVLDAAF